jgi:hypothetical protein
MAVNNTNREFRTALSAGGRVGLWILFSCGGELCDRHRDTRTYSPLVLCRTLEIGTIACELDLHLETVSAAVETDRFNNTKMPRNAADPCDDLFERF